jgi:hypothetical protein
MSEAKDVRIGKVLDFRFAGAESPTLDNARTKGDLPNPHSALAELISTEGAKH